MYASSTSLLARNLLAASVILVSAAARTSCLVTAIVLVTSVVTVLPAFADDVTDDDAFYARLRTPLVSVVQGQSFRAAMQGIADQAEVNLWIDRHVDPSRSVDIGQIGPTVFQAIRQIADSGDCVVMPVESVVLVGRESWVDRTAAALLNTSALQFRIPLQTAATRKIDLEWPHAMTPNEVVKMVARKAGFRENSVPELPHDLWPAATLRKLTPAIVGTLVLAQFDLRPKDLNSLGPETTPAPSRLARTYRDPEAATAIRAAVSNTDKSARIRVENGGLKITASARAHRAATIAFCQAAAGKAPNADATFDLQLRNKPAGAVLKQLAASAQLPLTIADAAVEKCQTLITLSAKAQTLRQLANEIGNQAGVTVEWSEKAVNVR